MLTRRSFSAGLAGSFLLSPSVALAQQPAQGVGRRGEADALRRFAETTHPRGREAAADAAWRQRWTRIDEAVERLSDGAYVVALRRALGWFQDGHTTVLPFEFVGGVPAPLRPGSFGLSLPARARLFHDGAFLVAAGSSALPYLGRRIVSLGSLSAAQLVRRIAADWPGNPAWAHHWASAMFVSPAFLQGFEAISDPAAPVRLGFDRGATELIPARDPGELRPVERTPRPHEAWAAAANGGNYVRPLAERRALYVSIDEMGDTTARSFEALTRNAFAAMELPDAARLVLDLRRNGGGDNYLGEALRKRIAASRFNRPGALYVLTGPATFSAAQNLANRLERETFAIFVGEPTGGAPNHYGDARPFTGDATGIVAIVSTIPWFDSYPQDRRPWIAPDLPVPDLFEDWRTGRDAALEAALTDRPEASRDELDRNRILYFSRPSQGLAWRPFWHEAGSNAA